MDSCVSVCLFCVNVGRGSFQRRGPQRTFLIYCIVRMEILICDHLKRTPFFFFLSHIEQKLSKLIKILLDYYKIENDSRIMFSV